MRRVKILTVKASRAISRSGLPDIDYALNPYIGCSHGCIYCYARLYTRHREVAENWGSIVIVKENLLEVLRKETKKYKPGVIGLSTITDPYQPVEAIYRLSRGSLRILLENNFHVSIQTKNPLILRDLDILVNYRNRVDVGFTITTLNNSIARLIEPYSPPPSSRAKALIELSRKNIDTWIFYGPVIPGLNDDIKTIDHMLNLALETNSKILIDNLHVKPFMKKEDHPLRKYIARTSKSWWKTFLEIILRKCREYGVKCITGYAEPMENITLDKYFVK